MMFSSFEKRFSDFLEQQYLVTSNGHSFWLSLPAEAPERCPIIFVFSGRRGTGCTCNIAGADTDSIPSTFRRSMISAGYGFACAVCSEYAWGDLHSTEETLSCAEECRNHGLNVSEKLNIMGFSMGGLGALMFAVRHPEKVACLIDFFGVTDLEDFHAMENHPKELDALTEAERLQRSPLRHAEQLKGLPVLILHGDQDIQVPLYHSERMHQALLQQGNDCVFKVIPGFGHTNNLLMEAEPAVQSFLAALK